MNKDQNQNIYPSVIVGILTFLIVSIGYWFWTAVGLGFCAFIFYLYLSRLGRTIPLIELMLLMSALQWVLGAHQAYALDYQHFKYYMYVDRELYMSTVVPGLLAYALGILLFYPKYSFSMVNEALEKITLSNPGFPIYLIIIGFIAPLVGSYLPPAFAFVVFLLGNFKFVGAVLWLFRPGENRKWWITIILMLLTFISSIQAGVFHDLLLWLALMLSFIAYRIRVSFTLKLSLISLGFFLAFILQSVKYEFRGIVRNDELNGRTKNEVFFNLVGDRISRLDEIFSNESYLGDINVRLNQGWIISAIINNVPYFEPYANGETIIEAFQASLVPRILSPEKKIAGGEENFERFTGLPLLDTASMGTSILGEAYGNFGKVGSWVFMFFWGMFLSWGYGRLIKYGEAHPIIHVFIPLIFLQVIKAETETYVVLNHFVKSSILVFAFLWFARRFWGLKI